MSCRMEVQVFLYTYAFEPSFHRIGQHICGKSVKYESFTTWTDNFHEIVSDRNVCHVLCFLHTFEYTPSAFGQFLDVLPLQSKNVASSEACYTGENDSLSQYRNRAFIIYDQP